MFMKFWNLWYGWVDQSLGLYLIAIYSSSFQIFACQRFLLSWIARFLSSLSSTSVMDIWVYWGRVINYFKFEFEVQLILFGLEVILVNFWVAVWVAANRVSLANGLMNFIEDRWNIALFCSSKYQVRFGLQIDVWIIRNSRAQMPQCTKRGAIIVYRE